ncbi:unnamed protein product [Wuchereria bancrofti]|uniref:Reverse transcriptase domain-containing protein n=1 Tax=Wuchereria bancrofti TaxID=6293 RepID=A0A3P7EES3_WUCBA|nr:unnamed protein product [Wuchereria bancrofti]
MIADVEKAFLQVSLYQEDRDVTRFLWLKDKSKEVTQENLVTYRFKRVPFGVISSPFLLAAVIRHLLNKENSELSVEIAKNLYVDNIAITSENASQRAVGLAVYSRRSNSTPGEPKLIYGKTRLVPKRESRNKSASIPRLELLAVTIGVRVLEFIKQEIYVEKTYLWTDSACVLHWLRKPPIGSKYISNRIDEIKRSKDIEFRHVRSVCNPADLASRGLLPEKLIERSLWWNGPSWLSKPKERWPEDEIMKENIMSVCMAMGLMEEETIQSEQVCTTLIDVARFSSLRKLMRTILYVLRFIAKVSKEKIRSLIGFSKENFTSKEYDRATILLLRNMMEQRNFKRKDTKFDRIFKREFYF